MSLSVILNCRSTNPTCLLTNSVFSVGKKLNQRCPEFEVFKIVGVVDLLDKLWREKITSGTKNDIKNERS